MICYECNHEVNPRYEKLMSGINRHVDLSTCISLLKKGDDKDIIHAKREMEELQAEPWPAGGFGG